MDIKIEDYLDEQEIKEICKDALYQKIREDMRKLNVNDIIANISYAEVAAMVDTYVGEDNFCKKRNSAEGSQGYRRAIHIHSVSESRCMGTGKQYRI